MEIPNIVDEFMKAVGCFDALSGVVGLNAKSSIAQKECFISSPNQGQFVVLSEYFPKFEI